VLVGTLWQLAAHQTSHKVSTVS